MARGMARTVTHSQSAVTHFDSITIKQPARGLEGLNVRETKLSTLRREAINPELIAGIGAYDRKVELAGKLSGPACMVDMRVGQPDLRERQPLALDYSQYPIKIATRIDDCCLLSLVTP